MTFANSLDPDEAPQNVGPHVVSKLFDTQIVLNLECSGGRYIRINI